MLRDNSRDWPEGVYFIKTELQTGLMFSSIALAAASAQKIARNTANARKAYDTALRLVQRVTLTTEESEQFEHAFARLKRELVQLGESVP